MRNRWGVLFQGGALFSTLTVGENVEVPLKQFYPELDPRAARRDRALQGACCPACRRTRRASIPSELSGGMRKRAGLARALALDPGTAVPRRADRRLDPIGAARVRRADARTDRHAGPDGVPDHPRPRYAVRDLRPGGGAGRQEGDRGRHDPRTAGDATIRGSRNISTARAGAPPKASAGSAARRMDKPGKAGA